MIRYPDLHPDNFVHPSDRQALQALRALPGLDELVRALHAETMERQVHQMLASTGVRVGPDQHPELYVTVQRACAILDLPEPHTYVVNQLGLNASTFGYREHTLVVHGALLDLLDPDERLAVIGHELGHILCEHLLYRNTAWWLTRAGGMVLGRLGGGLASLAMAPIEAALSAWSRASELSCDRAALLVTGEADVVVRLLGRLASGSRQPLSLSALRAQANAGAAAAGWMGMLLDQGRQQEASHPDPLPRIAELDRWASSSAHAAIRAGRYLTRREARRLPPIVGLATCVCCGHPNPEHNDAPCLRCAAPRSGHQRCEEGHPNDPRWSFCRTCGVSLRGEA